MSPSVGRRSPTRSDSSDSPVRGRRSPPRGRNTPSRRERSSVSARHRTSPKAKARSPVRPSTSHRDREKEKPVSRVGRSLPKRQISTSPSSESPSPGTKRLKRAQSERVVDKGSDKERSTNSSRVGDKERHKREGEKERHSREGDKERQKREGEKEKHHHEGDKEKHHSREGDKERHHSLEGDTERHHSCEGDKERHNRDDLIDRRERSVRDKQDGVSSKSRHRRSESPPARGNINRHNSNSPSRVSRGGARDKVINPSGDEHPDENDSLARMKAAAESLEEKQKQKPSFELSGKLADETNRVRGVTLLFTEPSDARKPDVRWRLYVFKAGEALNEPLYIHRQSCYLFGRERRVADIPTDHPSCSKQHAVIQFRQVDVEKPDGMLSKQVRPYVMDLGSTNGTFLNDSRIDPQRYYELFEKDTLKFGNSSREYVILHENSA